MAAYMRSVIILLSTERNALLRRGCDYTVVSRRYVRGLRRTPVKVLFPDSNRETVAPPKGSEGRKEPKPAPPKAPGMKRTFSPPAAIMIPSHASVPASEQSNITFSKDRIGGLRFETAFPGDKRLARVVSIARSRTFREHQGKILLEGKRLICDALEAGAHPQMVFFSRVEKLCELPLDKLKRATLVKVKFEEIKIWSELVAPQGVMAIFSRPDPEKMSFPKARPTVPLSLICDNIRDPGNMGTILRSAAAAGCRDILLTKGCVDPWEPKVLRAAMGAHFRLPVHCSLDWKDIRARLPEHTSVHVADNYCGPASAEEEEVTEHRHAEVRGQPTGALKGDYGWVSTRRGRGNPDHAAYDSDSDSDDETAPGLQLPRVDALLYHEGWGRGPAALVVGGETHGLSLESVGLAAETGGRRLRIPMVPGVDSLNSAMAASILLFEGRRQMLDSVETSARKGKAERRLI
ncbi:rRNA methyltransferase 3A, mitochondrial [Gadus morhua]|uniref:Mitochondrial rRNA methyltransferase 3a n=1 Tax=Gadus morhua TaxID=8049 RepID=A0A8C5FFF8_GADMO|nr:rRNA methyltransferase 3, mitochondrial [Gadus morhua]